MDTVVGHPQPRPSFGEIDLLAGDVDHRRTDRVARRVHDQRLGQLHHVGDIAERLVRLHHRELGVVGGIHPLVAERPADLENSVEATDDQPLEVELGGDAQVQREVEGVVVSHERPGVGAAGLDVKDRCLHFDEPTVEQCRAEARHDGMTDLEDPSGVGVDGEVGVPLPIANIRVGESMPLVGKRAKRLGEQHEVLDLDGDLAGTGCHHRPGGSDPITSVEGLDVRELFVADHRLGDEQLEVDAAIGDREEHELAGVALEHQAPGDRHGDVGLGARSELGAELAHIRRAVHAVEAVRIGLTSGGAQVVDSSLSSNALGGEAASRRRRRVARPVVVVAVGHGARRYQQSIWAAIGPIVDLGGHRSGFRPYGRPVGAVP